MGYELGERLRELCRRVGGARAAVIFERTGIEVAAWGDTDAETAAAEVAELWQQASDAETLARAGGVTGLDLRAAGATWVTVPLGREYVLAVLAGAEIPPGKARFYAAEWARLHGEEFA